MTARSFPRGELGRSLWTLRREFAWCGLFSLFANGLLLTSTIYMLQIYDRVMLSGSVLTLLALTLIAVLFYATMAFADWVRSRLMVRVSARLDDALSSRAFRAAFESALRQPGRNQSQALNDLNALRQFVTGNGVFAFFDTPWAPIYLVVLFLMDKYLGIAGLVFMAVQFGLAWINQRVASPLHRRAADAGNDVNAYLVSKLRNAETVEAMGMLGNLRAQWLTLHERMLDLQAAAQRRAQGMQALTRLVQGSQQSLILTVGALLALQGRIGVGAMIASNALLANALRPISTLVSTWRMAVEAAAAYRRLDALLEANPEREAGHAPETVAGRIRLQGLSASAPQRQAPILRDLDADFPPGRVTAIVGPSGAGKSTLARCLVGIWPQTSGRIELDGVPLEQWSRSELGPHIGYLPQDVQMLDGTIAENIARFGAVDSARVIDAATHTGIHDMVLRLPKGYDTPMGEAGMLLSGGQRQRVALARALYGEPTLVVLDEPNSNLDDAGEAALLRAVRSLRDSGKTVFMIVHQKNLLAAADRVMTLEAGRITRTESLAEPATAPQIEG